MKYVSGPGGEIPVGPSRDSFSNVLDGVIRCYRPSGQYERWAFWVIVVETAREKSPPHRCGAAARYGSPVRRYTLRAGDRSIMLSGRFWNLASCDKIHCGRDAAMSRRQKTALEVRIARNAPPRPDESGRRSQTTRPRDMGFSPMSKNKIK